jgi:hypothetical protein
MSAIKVGDMVMVVRWPHPCTPKPKDRAPGMPFVVESLGDCWCTNCFEVLGPGAATGEAGVPLAWLKKIEPDAKLEENENHEELLA